MKLLPPGILKDYFYNLKKDITSSAFGRWFIENESKPEFDQELQEIWKESSQVACDREMTSSAFVKVCEAIGGVAPSPQKSTFTRTIHYLIRVAAILFIPLLGATLYLYLDNKESQVNWIEVYAEYGQKKEVILPDQSKVWLNSGTHIIYPERFTQVRQIFVSGETFLEVTKDPERPFIVDTKDLSIKVHGTRFNVRSYTEDKGTEATLLEGSISLLVKGDLDQHDIFLVPGEKAILDKKQVKLEKFDVDGYQSWRNGQYTFRDKTLQEIITELQRLFNVQIVIRDKALLKEIFFVTFAQGLSLDEMLEALNIDNELCIKRDQDIIEFSRKTR